MTNTSLIAHMIVALDTAQIEVDQTIPGELIRGPTSATDMRTAMAIWKDMQHLRPTRHETHPDNYRLHITLREGYLPSAWHLYED